MSSIRFEPSVSATFTIDRKPTGTGGDLFADMLGEHMKKRATADRPDSPIRRKPQADRPIHEDERPASPRPGPVIKHAHDLRDVATDARDVTPRKDEQARLAAPADHSGACMDDQAPTDEAPANESGADEATVDAVVAETAPDKEQPTDQQQPVLVSVQVAPEAPAEAPAEIVAVAADPQASLPIDGQLVPDAEAAPATVTPAEPAPTEAAPADPKSGAVANPEAQQKEDAAQANFAATLAASLGDTMAGLVGGDAAIDPAAGAEALASVSMTTLATPKAAAPASAESSEAAVELAANLTPETPRPITETKVKSAVRAIPASEIKAHATGAQPAANPQPQPAAQALAHAAPNAAFNRALDEGFDTGFGNDGVGTPGWTLHLAQGAANKRPDFIAQLRQHLQELPAHEQVAVNIQRAMRQGANQMTIQLSPAELGKIHVKLEIDEEKRVTAAVTVEKPSTLELLQRDVKGLERALQEAGLKVDGNDLSFSLGRQNGQEFSQEMRQGGTAGFGNGTGEAQAEGDVAAVQAAAQVDTAAGVVNVQI